MDFRIKHMGWVCFTLGLGHLPPAYGQDLGPFDRLSDIVETVQDGLDNVWPDDLNVDGLSLRFGGGVGVSPDYLGSNNYRARFVPFLSINYKNRIELDNTRLTYNAYRKNAFTAGPRLNLTFGRSEKRNKVLQGLGDIGDTVELGGFAQYKTQKMLVDFEVRHALGARQGLNMRLNAGHGIYRRENLLVGVGVKLRWQSKKTMQTFFGVTPQQSARSAFNLRPFDASSGFSEAAFNVLGALRINDRARMMGLFSYGRLLGDAGNSPIVGPGPGSANQFLLGFGFSLGLQ